MMSAEPMVFDCNQRDEAWRAARVGIATASRVVDIVTTLKPKKGGKPAGEAAARRNYRTELVVETLTRIPTPEPYVTPEMQWGADQEPYARAAYEMVRDVTVETCGFFIHPTIDRFGASPDGLVGDDGLLQLKCPSTSKHLAWILEGKVPIEYAPQLLAELACTGTGRQWIDFASFDPRVPEHLQLFVVRYERNETLIAELERQVVAFLAEVDETIAKLPAAPDPGVEFEPVDLEAENVAGDASEPEETLAAGILAPAPSGHLRPEPDMNDYPSYEPYHRALRAWDREQIIGEIRELLLRMLPSSRPQ